MTTPTDPVSVPVVAKPGARETLDVPDVQRGVAIAAILSDATRATILAMLRSGPHCVCELAAATGERENNVSNHLARLRDAGLVRASRHALNGRFLYYELEETAIADARSALSVIL